MEIFGEWVDGVVATSRSTTRRASGSARERRARRGSRARLAGRRRRACEVLGGGITNHNLKVTRPDGVVVLRVAGTETGLLGIDRQVEHAATLAAAAVGVGPRVVRFVEPEGWLVTGSSRADPATGALREPAQLARVARPLRAFHDGPPIPGRFETIEVVEAYRDTAVGAGSVAPGRVRRRARDCAADRAASCRCRRRGPATTTS